MARWQAIMFGVFVAALYLVGLNDFWAITPDSGLYMSLGRSLVEGRGMEFNGEQWSGIFPVVPLLIAGCRWLVGSHVWLINLVMRLFALGFIAFSFLIFDRLQKEFPDRMRMGLVAGATIVVALPAIVVICAGISLPKIVREIYRMRQPQFYAAYDGGEWKDYVQLGAYLREHGRPATDRVLARQQAILYSLTRLRFPSESRHEIFPPFTRPSPASFVNLAVKNDCRFVVIASGAGRPSGEDRGHGGDSKEQEWGEGVRQELIKTRLFLDSPLP
jgi:hypothetical protein